MIENDKVIQNEDKALRHVTDLLLLQQRIRSAPTLTELGYMLVNDTSKIAPYQVAVLNFDFPGRKKVEAISGLPKPTANSPFIYWFDDFYKAVKAEYKSTASTVDLSRLNDDIQLSRSDFLPPDILYLPLISKPDNTVIGSLILARNQSWLKEELGVLTYWSHAVSHTVSFLRLYKRGLFSRFKTPRTLVLVMLGLLLTLVMFKTVSLSALAPVEVVAQQPSVVRAPIDGVVGELHIKPNMRVNKGQLLFTLDDASLNARLDVARQELEIAKAEYRRTEQASVTDRRASAEIPMLKARIEQRRAEFLYISSLLERISVRATQEGVAIINDINALEGKPVTLGEKVMIIASPQITEAEIWLAVGDSLQLPDKARVELFLNIKPESPYSAVLKYMNYQAELSPEGILAFRARAHIEEDGAPPRVGLRGTAKLYGHKVPLYYYLFRRPYAAARQWLGL
jgi:hypothetical protein